MALQKCKECGDMVSNEAKTCPHCGRRVKKSRWGIVILFALIVGACVIILPIMRGRQIEQENAKVEGNLKAIVEDNVRELLNEKYGIQCVAINLLEGSDGSFSGTAKLEDGREIDIDDARIDGEMIRFNRSVKQGYEYKCKHHFGQLKIGKKSDYWSTKPVLAGEIWNDGSEPIRGFVAAEFVDDNGNGRVYYKDRKIAFIPSAPDQYSGISGVSAWWIPPGKNATFIYDVPDEVLKLNDINAKLEFFNLGNEPPASYVYDNPFDKSILEIIPVKVTSQIYKIQRDKANEDAEQ